MPRPPSTRAEDQQLAGHVTRLRATAARLTTANEELDAARHEQAQAAHDAHAAGLTWREIAGLLGLRAHQQAVRLARTAKT